MYDMEVPAAAASADSAIESAVPVQGSFVHFCPGESKPLQRSGSEPCLQLTKTSFQDLEVDANSDSDARFTAAASDGDDLIDVFD